MGAVESGKIEELDAVRHDMGACCDCHVLNPVPSCSGKYQDRWCVF